MKRIYTLWVAGLLSSTAFASQPYTVEITGVRGEGCPDPSKVSVEISPLGEYYITAAFNEEEEVFIAETDNNRTTARVGCTIDYVLRLAPNYKLDYAEFLIDGQYNLSETGVAFYSIRHNVPGLANPTYHNVSYSALDGDLLNDNFILYGYIEGIDDRVNYCGAAIPLQVQIRGTARQARNDNLTTFIAIDNAEGHPNAKRGVRKIKCTPWPVPCL